MRPGRHFGTRQRLLGQIWQRRIHRPVQNMERAFVAGEFMGVDQSDVDLVEGVGGQRIVFIETRCDRRREASDQAAHFCLRRTVSRDRGGASERGNILAEAVARYEPMQSGPGLKRGDTVYQPPRSSPGAGNPAARRNGLSRASSSIANSAAWVDRNCASIGPSSNVTSP